MKPESSSRNALTVHYGRASDHPAVTNIYVASYTHAFGDLFDMDPAVRDSEIAAALAECHTLLVARDGGKVVGFLLCSHALTEMRKLYVHPDAQGHGVGTALIDFYLGLAASLLPPTATLTLSVNAVNTPAIALYETFGYIDSGERLPSRIEGEEQRVYARPALTPVTTLSEGTP